MGGFLLSRPPTSVEIICWGGGWLVGSLRLASVGGGHMDHARVEVAGGTVGGTGGCTARGLAWAHLAGTSMMGGLVGGCACACARGLAGGHSPGLGRGARAVTASQALGGAVIYSPPLPFASDQQGHVGHRDAQNGLGRGGRRTVRPTHTFCLHWPVHKN